MDLNILDHSENGIEHPRSQISRHIINFFHKTEIGLPCAKIIKRNVSKVSTKATCSNRAETKNEHAQTLQSDDMRCGNNPERRIPIKTKFSKHSTQGCVY